jgi:Glutaminase
MSLPHIQNVFRFYSAPRPLQPDEALSVFAWLGDMKDLAHGDLTGGSDERTHLAGLRLREKGLPLRAAWAVAADDRRIAYSTPDGKDFSWQFRRALVLPVDMGALTPMVFDNGMFDGPATLHEWASRMKNIHPRRLLIASFDADGKDGDMPVPMTQLSRMDSDDAAFKYSTQQLAGRAAREDAHAVHPTALRAGIENSRSYRISKTHAGSRKR